jgi:hypothetical protein
MPALTDARVCSVLERLHGPLAAQPFPEDSGEYASPGDAYSPL